jgi:YidC/Oxa1 family membrane protein insertase
MELLLIPMSIWDPFIAVGSAIMQPLYWVVSGILVLAHSIFSPVLGADSGWTWVLSIMFLTVVIRIALIPLFVKQIKSSRNMQLLQPKVRELQKKHGHDREKLGQETMKLYRENNANPLASCLPLLLQIPIFLALFRVLDGAARGIPRGHWLVINPDLLTSLNQATIFGARISDTFLKVVSPTASPAYTSRHPGADHRHDGHLVHHAAAADAQNSLRALTGPFAQRQRSCSMSSRWFSRSVASTSRRRPDLLVHIEPVDDGPAVLCDSPQPSAGNARV